MVGTLPPTCQSCLRRHPDRAAARAHRLLLPRASRYGGHRVQKQRAGVQVPGGRALCRAAAGDYLHRGAPRASAAHMRPAAAPTTAAAPRGLPSPACRMPCGLCKRGVGPSVAGDSSSAAIGRAEKWGLWPRPSFALATRCRAPWRAPDRALARSLAVGALNPPTRAVCGIAACDRPRCARSASCEEMRFLSLWARRRLFAPPWGRVGSARQPRPLGRQAARVRAPKAGRHVRRCPLLLGRGRRAARHPSAAKAPLFARPLQARQ